MWAEYRREFCLDTWERSEDHPSPEEVMAVYLRMMDLREDPHAPPSLHLPSVPPEPQLWITDVPNTDLICILYLVYDAEGAIEYLMIERI